MFNLWALGPLEEFVVAVGSVGLLAFRLMWGGEAWLRRQAGPMDYPPWLVRVRWRELLAAVRRTARASRLSGFLS